MVFEQSIRQILGSTQNNPTVWGIEESQNHKEVYFFCNTIRGNHIMELMSLFNTMRLKITALDALDGGCVVIFYQVSFPQEGG